VSFDRIAPHYRWLETISFGNALQHARTFWIDKISRPRRVLICGEGNGRFLCELLRVHSKIDIDCLDASAPMLDLARRRVLRACPESFSRVHFIHKDVRNWFPQNSYDLFVTHFFFDCFPRAEVQSIAAKIAHAAGPNAVWLISDFTVPLRGTIAQLHACAWLRIMYFFFRSTAGIAANELVDATPSLEANGFSCAAQKLSRGGMLKADLFRAVR
jgi:ubiquinone/menaquinone biosynthesis C-methylase UbiE